MAEAAVVIQRLLGCVKSLVIYRYARHKRQMKMVIMAVITFSQVMPQPEAIKKMMNNIAVPINRYVNFLSNWAKRVLSFSIVFPPFGYYPIIIRRKMQSLWES